MLLTTTAIGTVRRAIDLVAEFGLPDRHGGGVPGCERTSCSSSAEPIPYSAVMRNGKRLLFVLFPEQREVLPKCCPRTTLSGPRPFLCWCACPDWGGDCTMGRAQGGAMFGSSLLVSSNLPSDRPYVVASFFVDPDKLHTGAGSL